MRTTKGDHINRPRSLVFAENTSCLLPTVILNYKRYIKNITYSFIKSLLNFLVLLLHSYKFNGLATYSWFSVNCGYMKGFDISLRYKD